MNKVRKVNTATNILLYCRNAEYYRELEEILKRYSLQIVQEIREVYRILDDSPPSLILTDSKDIEPSERKREIPVLFICHTQELEKETLLLPPHIKDVITAPFVSELVLRRIENYLNLSSENPALKNRKLYELLFDLIPAYVFIKNREGRFLAVNSSFANALKLKKEEIEGFLHIEVQSGRRDIERMLEDDQKVFNSGIPLNISLEKFRDGAGNIRWLQTTKIPCPYEIFGEDAIVGFAVDITDMRDAEIKLEHNLDREHFSDKMETIGKIAGGLAHDFNNILSGILSASELLKTVVLNNEKAMEYSSLINESAQKAADLNKKLLNFSIKNSRESIPFEAHEALENIISILKNSLNQNICINYDPQAGQNRILGNSIMLQDALLSLGVNASHAMPEGGTLNIRTLNMEIDEEYCQTSLYKISPGRYFRIEIKDTGCGIDPEIMPKIFDPFFTTKIPTIGTGLGLAEVYNIITLLKGAIEVHSTIGKGSCFALLIPLSEKEPPRAQPEPEIKKETSPPPVRSTILLVDDEPILRKMLTNLLEKAGYTVIAAENGKQGLFQFKRLPDLFDLIIMDMVMPEMTGAASYDAIKSINPDIKVLFISGYFRDHNLKEITESDKTGFIHKPFKGEQILKKVREMLE